LLKKFNFNKIKTTGFFNYFFKILNSLMILRLLEYVYSISFNEIKGNLETKSFRQTKIKGRTFHFSDLKISVTESNSNFYFFYFTHFSLYK